MTNLTIPAVTVIASERAPNSLHFVTPRAISFAHPMLLFTRIRPTPKSTRVAIQAITRRLSDAQRYHYPEGTTKESARLFRKKEKKLQRKEREKAKSAITGFGYVPEFDIRSEPCPEREAQERLAIRNRMYPKPGLEELDDRVMMLLSGGPADDLIYIARAGFIEREMSENGGQKVRLTEDVPHVYKALVDEIIRCDELYYADDPKPRVTDEVYDELVMHLLELERRFPELIVPHSPSQNVAHCASARAVKLGSDEEVSGSPVDSLTSFASTVPVSTKRFAPYRHCALMLSLDNAYSHDDLLSFLRRAEAAESSIAAELKIDGVALSLEYRHGKLAVAATRGTGRIGDNVTENAIAALTGRGLVHDIPAKNVPTWMVVRGEVFISTEDFIAVNETLDRPLSNARNAAAGALKHKDLDECKKRRLRFIAYECITANPDDVKEAERRSQEMSNQAATSREESVQLIVDAKNVFSSQEETLSKLEGWGFGKMPRSTVCSSLEEIEKFAEDIERERAILDMEVDGIVFKMNSARAREKAGHTARAPRGAIAYKFAAQARVTKVIDVVMQVSRQGIITPVAVLEPVRVGGAVLSRATLHNFEEVRRLGVAVGDEVRLERGGDVIPKVISVERQGDPDIRRLIEPPETCPCCGRDIEAKEEGKNRAMMYFCKNHLTCTAQSLGRLLHFAGKDAMDIQTLGKKTAQRLVSEGLVIVLADVFRLTVDDIMSLEGFAERSALKLLASISEAATSRSFERLLLGLGLPGIGRISARSLAVKFESIDGLLSIATDEKGTDTLLSIPNIAEKTAVTLHAYLRRDQTITELKALQNLVKPDKIVDEEDIVLNGDDAGDPANAMSGSTFAFTGKFVAMNRPRVLKWVKGRGARVVSDVSKKTDFVVCGIEPGNKLFKAQRLDICIVQEEEFFDYFKVPKDVQDQLRESPEQKEQSELHGDCKREETHDVEANLKVTENITALT